MTTDTKINRLTFRIVSGLTLLFLAFFSFINLSEWYIIAIQKDLRTYPFNGEGPVPYYYKSADLYSAVTLIWGITLLTILIFTVWTIVKNQRRRTLIASALTVFAVTLQFIHGQIG